MRAVPLTLKEANEFVGRLHRHHKPVVGHRFSIGCMKGCEMVGAVIVGRPVARNADQSLCAEVTRLCTDGTKNACSFLYASAARAAQALGYDRIQTFILESEPGTSLKASGWDREIVSPGGQWQHSGDKQKRLFSEFNRRSDQPNCRKVRWAKVFTPKEAE